METSRLSLQDVKTGTFDYHRDKRGEIFTTYKDSHNCISFRHDKVAIRKYNCLVGIHGDFTATKLVTCLFGTVFCAVVDVRIGSKDYNKHKTFVLSGENKKYALIPPGVGNSFYVQSEVCVYNYKLAYQGDYPDVNDQFTLRWNDPIYGIDWPCENPLLSDRDSFS